MGVGNFPITNPLIGGGTALNDIVAQLAGPSVSDVFGRAQIGSGLFGNLLQQQLQAAQRPISIVDQLLLGGQFGTTLPFSQLTPQKAAQISQPSPPGLQNLFQSLSSFAQGALPQSQVAFLMRDEQGAPTQAVVRIPGGGLDIVDIPAGEGNQVVQGRAGPFNLNLDDIRRLDIQAQQRLQQEFRNQPDRDPQEIIDFTRRVGGIQADQFLRDVLDQRRRIGDTSQPLQQPQGVQGDFNQDQRVDSKDAAIILQREAGLIPGMQAGGTLRVDPRRAQTSGSSIAGPAIVVDRLGQPAAQIGEGQGSETVSNVIPFDPTSSPQITPQEELRPGIGEAPGQVVPLNRPRPTGRPSMILGDFATDLEPGVQQFMGLPRDVAFRLQSIMDTIRGTQFESRIDPRVALQIAQRPGDFEQFTGIERDPIQQARAVAARGLAGGLQQDVRFGDPFVKALSLGLPPTPMTFSAREFQDLGPFNQDILRSIIGPQNFPSFAFAVGQGTPTGRSGVRQAGGVRV